MKKRTVILFVAIAALVLVGFTSCGFNGDIVGTEWTYETLGTGVGLKFETATTGHSTVGLLGSWGNLYSFTYTYDSIAKTGNITFDSGDTLYPFSIDGNNLTYSSTVYKLKQ